MHSDPRIVARSYKDSAAYRRSQQRTRPDGTPVWPLRTSDLPGSMGGSKVFG